jgi:hypothetical protein
MEYLWPLYSVRITIVTIVGKQILSTRAPTWCTNCRGSLLPVVNFLSIAFQAWMVSTCDNRVYSGSGLGGVIPYV